MDEFPEHLDIPGQQDGLFKLYTQLSLFYPVSDASSHPSIISTLTAGLERLTASFPWVAGQVVKEGPDESASRGYKIKPFERIPRLVAKDLRDDPSMPSLDDFRKAQFPFSMLDENVIAPMNTLAAGTEGPAPVFMVQANFITGGLLLTFVTQHNVMDMTGQVQLMYLLCKACHDAPFAEEDLYIGNIDRRTLVPLLDESYTPGPELKNQIVKPSAAAALEPKNENENGQEEPPPPAPAPAPCSWVYFLFSSESLAQLKRLAKTSITTTSSSGFVSTDDVLSAFIFQGVTRARLARLDDDSTTTFARAIDPRRYLNIPTTYPGLVQNMTYHTYPPRELVKQPLGVIASQMRMAIDPRTSTLAYDTRALMTWMHRAPHDEMVSVTAKVDTSRDIMLSSWAKFGNCYNFEFNMGVGPPEAVRRPRFYPVESLFYLMPRRRPARGGDDDGGEIAAALCLRDEDLERIKGDEEFGKYGVFIG